MLTWKNIKPYIISFEKSSISKLSTNNIMKIVSWQAWLDTQLHRRIDNMEPALSLLIIDWVQRTALVSTNLLQLLGWQPITAIFAASSEDGLLIGQFLVCPAMSQPINRDQVGALVMQ